MGKAKFKEDSKKVDELLNKFMVSGELERKSKNEEKPHVSTTREGRNAEIEILKRRIAEKNAKKGPSI